MVDFWKKSSMQMTWWILETSRRSWRKVIWDVKKVIEEKGLKVNIGKTKAFCVDKREMQILATKYLCAICGKGVKSIPSNAGNI